MDDLGRGFLVIFGGIVTIAIVSVIVGRNSQAPQALQAASGALAQIVAAAVNPAGTNAANPVSNNQSVASPPNPLGSLFPATLV
jgi:hypothetical protein